MLLRRKHDSDFRSKCTTSATGFKESAIEKIPFVGRLGFAGQCSYKKLGFGIGTDNGPVFHLAISDCLVALCQRAYSNDDT
ncbi:hypothetical protein PVK06_016474 [Gossypium arboreum]|uniref:Uncharacterized protein n=1 Tax=Gossypium arboreum TaxID=29729 RepID=A0ABR0Q0S8_GOSAR|nr:hypothetical protein PVK06_016474 [Gossypium arboreum]